jgi:hypothetical protein
VATSGTENPASTNRLMEAVCERENLKAASRQVKPTKGSPGVDGMTVVGIKDYLKQHWPAIREQLLNGTYEPELVRRVENTAPPPGSAVGAGGATAAGKQHRRQRVRPVSREGQSPVCRVFECGLQIARVTVIVRGNADVTNRTAVYGPVPRSCGRGRRVTAAPMPINAVFLPR